MEAKEIYLLVVFSFLSIIYASVIVFSSITPLGVDWNNFHLKAVEAYARGDISYLSKYPPAFQLLFVPLALLNIIDYAIYVQILFYALAIILPVYFAYKVEGFKVAMIVGFLLLASGAYLDRAIQLNPEALELSLFPIALLLYSKKHYIAGSVILLYLSYNHIIGFVFTLIPLVYCLIFKSKATKYLLCTLVLTIPVLFYFKSTLEIVSPGLPGFIATHLPEASKNAMFLQTHPIPFLYYFGMFSIALLPFLVGLIFYKFKKRYNLYLIWLVAFSPLSIILIDRWIQYILLPLSILEALALNNFIEKIKKGKRKV